MAMELLIGRVIKSHGIRGEVVVDPTTDEPDIRFANGAVLNGTQGQKKHQLTVAHSRPHKGRLLVTFEEVKDRTAADSLRGTKFFAAPLEDPDDDGFYDHELEGLKVRHADEIIGEITAVTHGPRQTLLHIGLTGGSEALIPFVTDIVPEVDLEAGEVTITPPEGLLEL